MATRKDNSITGAAGVFYVSAVLSLRGMIALPTIKNVAGYDILVGSSDGERHGNIQVKTSGARPKFWPVSATAENVRTGELDWYVFLQRRPKGESDPFEGYMVAGAEVKAELVAYKEDCLI